MSKINIGQVVISKSGRDKQKNFVVFNIEDEYLYLVDGDLRKVESPKKKKIKHVQLTKDVISEIMELRNEGASISNSNIRKLLKIYKNQNTDKEV